MSDTPGHDRVPPAINRKGRRGALRVRRLPVTFTSDIRRVITRFFDPGGEARIRNVVERVRGLSGGRVDRLLDDVFLRFRTRHGNIASVLDENHRKAMDMIELSDDFSHNRRMLIGAYLTAEYSIESAALFNPSIVPHHDQQNLPAGAVRFIMSLRATGEGHVSSIVFRSGVIYSDHKIQIDPCSRLTGQGHIVPEAFTGRHVPPAPQRCRHRRFDSQGHLNPAMLWGGETRHIAVPRSPTPLRILAAGFSRYVAVRSTNVRIFAERKATYLTTV